MSASGYHNVPIYRFPLGLDTLGTPSQIGIADVVIERNEGGVEMFVRIPEGSPLYDAFVSDLEPKELWLDGMWLDGMFERRG